VALNFVQQRLKMVNLERIFTAGHSSAANVSLLMAAHQPLLAGSVAYAPICDVSDSIKELIETPMVTWAFPGIRSFAKRSSPATHAAKTKVPVFVFAAQDDERISLEDVRAYGLAVKDAGGDSKVTTGANGGHYQSMIDKGIPAGIAWMKSK
jgi:dienelactone hydrolase